MLQIEKKIYSAVFNIILIINVFEQQIRILEWFLKDHVTGVMMIKKISFEITGINYILKYIQIEKLF